MAGRQWNPAAWTALFGFAPLLLIAMAPSVEQTLACLMVYSALAWAGYFYVVVAGRRPSLKIGLAVAAFTIAVGVPFGTWLIGMPPVSLADAATSETSGVR